MSNTIGWGKGASNNTIGWGNVGSNDFGSIYESSNSGETDLAAADNSSFIIEVDTSIAGASNSDQFQFTGAVGEYDVEAYQNDSLVASFNDLVNQQTITLPSAGIYELRVIPKPAGFDKLTFSNGGDKDKLLEVLQWGLYGVNEPDQSFAFQGCTNNTEIADGGAWFDVVTNGFRMFLGNSLTSLPSGMELPNLSSGSSMFNGNSLTSLPSGMELPNLTNGFNMFLDNSLTSLPAGMELPLLTNGQGMFNNNSLTSLPSGMELPNLSNGFFMFLRNSLTSLPAGMELPNLTDGRNMFLSNSLTSLPSGMELPNLTNGFRMFLNNSLTSLPAGMDLPNLSDGNSMFNSNSLTSLPVGMELPNLTDGFRMFFGNTINTTRYSQLLIDLEEFNPNNNVAFHGGNSQYNAQGEIARNLLISRGWTITDGGLENVFQTAAVAYSLRDLGLGATQVVRVRRSTDNVEQDFTANEITDGTLTSFCGAGDGFVSIWYNQGSGDDAVQNTASSQPKIVNNGSLIFDNGSPIIDFDGVDDHLSFSGAAYSSFASVFVVSTQVTGNNFQRFLNIHNGSSNLQLVDNEKDLLTKDTRFQGGTDSYIWVNSVSGSNLISAFFGSSDTSLFFNSNEETSNSGVSMVGGVDNLSTIGVRSDLVSSTFSSFNVNEILIYGVDKSAERQDIETNINDHYAIY